MKIVTDKLKECETAISKNKQNFNKHEEELKKLESKLHIMMTEKVKNSLREEVSSYKIETLNNKLFK